MSKKLQAPFKGLALKKLAVTLFFFFSFFWTWPIGGSRAVSKDFPVIDVWSLDRFLLSFWLKFSDFHAVIPREYPHTSDF